MMALDDGEEALIKKNRQCLLDIVSLKVAYWCDHKVNQQGKTVCVSAVTTEEASLLQQS